MNKQPDFTIKELADELGITKQAVRRYFDQLPTELIPTKKNGSYYINAKAQGFIRDRVNRTNTNIDSQRDTKIDSGVDTSVDSQNEKNFAEFQKEFIQDRNEQIKSLKEQVNKLHTLLDQQQQLTLQSNKQIDTLQLQLGTTLSEKQEEVKNKESLQDHAGQTEKIKKELEQKNLENEQLKKQVADLQQVPKKGFWQRLFHS